MVHVSGCSGLGTLAGTSGSSSSGSESGEYRFPVRDMRGDRAVAERLGGKGDQLWESVESV